jgi:hypothetical protein
MPVMPVSELLIGVTGAHEQRFLKMPAHKLKRDGQTFLGEPARQSDCRAAGHVERRGETHKSRETFRRGEKLAFLCNGEIAERLRRDEQEVNVGEQDGKAACEGKALMCASTISMPEVARPASMRSARPPYSNERAG